MRKLFLALALALPLAACSSMGSIIVTPQTKAQSMVFADHAFQATVETAELFVDDGTIKGLPAAGLAIGTVAANAGIDSQWRQVFPAPAEGGDIFQAILDKGRTLIPVILIADRHRAAANALIAKVQAEGRDIAEAEKDALSDARQAIVDRVVAKLEAAAR